MEVHFKFCIVAVVLASVVMLAFPPQPGYGMSEINETGFKLIVTSIYWPL